MLRSIDQSVVHGLRHPCLGPLLRAHVSDVDLPVMQHETVRHHVEEMPTPVGDFRRQHHCADRLPAPLKHAELFLLLPAESWRCDLESVGQSNHAVQAEIDAEGGRVGLFGLRQFDLDVDVLTPAGVGGASRASTNFRQGVNRVGVDAEIFGYASAKLRQLGIRWAPDGHAGLPAFLRLTVNLAAIIPDEINRSCLTSQSAANRTACILDAVSAGKSHSFHLLGLPTQCKSIDRKTQHLQGLSFIWSASPNTGANRCSGIGVAGGACSASLRQDGLSVVGQRRRG
jgi:hypothetical protein